MGSKGTRVCRNIWLKLDLKVPEWAWIFRNYQSFWHQRRQTNHAVQA